MAAPKKFRIPTVDEMDRASKEDLSQIPTPLFKKNKDATTAANSLQIQVPFFKRPTSDKTSSTNRLHSESTDTVQPEVVVAENTQEGVASTSHQSSDSSGTLTENSANQESVSSRVGSSNSLIVNTRQRGNPILKSVRNIPWEYGNIVPDYVMGQSNCALFLSLRYHQLHPNYIHERLKQLGKSYELRVLLVQVDVKDPHHLLKDLAKMCILADCTLILAFSAEEAGRYLETYKIFENKPPEAIMEKTEENFMAKFTDCLTSVKSVNKTDCVTLLSHFGNLSSVIEASKEDLSLCPGFGPQKANRLFDIFHEPFLRANKRKRRLSGSSTGAAS
ncbi:DNA excision repair protein ercc-1 [Plakobranchus ocellatus]|uniref:DNA excision repair protein ERCC-1 n=1 Tax=Plakobranchus ocellatus TaxID=259542 RepID=A0AAV4BA53_9GAST|nr:DNA excision repair protein ercc-1 [Plakobranchus ocellatus]